QSGGTVYGPHGGFAGKSDQSLFPHQRTGIPAHGGRRRSGERGLPDARLTNSVAVNFGRRECLPASGQNHFRRPTGKHADRNHPDRGRVPQPQESVATGAICTHSDANRKHHGSASGAAGGSESAARNLSSDSHQR